jgi:hypothetical protein
MPSVLESSVQYYVGLLIRYDLRSSRGRIFSDGRLAGHIDRDSDALDSCGRRPHRPETVVDGALYRDLSYSSLLRMCSRLISLSLSLLPGPAGARVARE